MSLGFLNAGHKILAAADNWEPALDVYRNNFDHQAVNWDLSKPFKYIDDIRQMNPEIIIGGPPCQDFSHAGKRTEGNKADLTFQFATIVGSVRPKWFVMENVERASKSEAYSRAREVFKDSGYGLTEVVLNAALCNVPQKRKRFFSVGLLGDKDSFLIDVINAEIAENEMTVRDYFGDTLDVEHYYRHPRNYNRRAIYSIDEPSATIRGVSRPVPEGYPGHIGDSVDVKSGVRPLTTIERAKIQTFPDEFVWLGSKTNKEQMIGNAVPVNLGAFVGGCIRKYTPPPLSATGSSNVVSFEEFKDWLRQKNYQGRYLNDLVSRLRRAIELTGSYEPHNICRNEIAGKLNDTKSKSVASQINRSLDLYREFKANNVS